MSNKNTSGENFVPSISNSVTSDQLIQFSQMMSSPEMKSYMANQVQENTMRSIREDLPKNIPMKNPNRRVEELLQDQIDQHSAAEQNLTEKLSDITSENKKLNAKIDDLNKTIRSQRLELDNLRDINRELIKTNRMMKENQKSDRTYWPKSIMLSVGVGILSFILGLFNQEVKTLLLSIPGLLQSFLQSIPG